MTDPTHEIAPRIVDGEPECSRQCPVYRETADGEMFDACHADMAFGENTLDGEPCIPGLRRQRDELHEKNKEAVVSLVAHSDNETRLLNASIQACAERDAARRELCQRNANYTRHDCMDVAASRGWGYLYETPEGGEG